MKSKATGLTPRYPARSGAGFSQGRARRSIAPGFARSAPQSVQSLERAWRGVCEEVEGVSSLLGGVYQIAPGFSRLCASQLGCRRSGTSAATSFSVSMPLKSTEPGKHRWTDDNQMQLPSPKVRIMSTNRYFYYDYLCTTRRDLSVCA